MTEANDAIRVVLAEDAALLRDADRRAAQRSAALGQFVHDVTHRRSTASRTIAIWVVFSFMGLASSPELASIREFDRGRQFLDGGRAGLIGVR